MVRSDWRLLNSGVKTAFNHMQTDEQLLADLKNNQNPILHFYEWENPSATYGYFIKPEKVLKLDAVKARGLDLSRRPTGGGVVFHLSDLAFSVLLPSSHPGFSLNTLNNYAFINEIISEAIGKFIGQNATHVSLLETESKETNVQAGFFCMAKATKYDVMLNGRKVGGGAERLTKHGLLHQGTIALQLPREDFLQDVLQSEEILHCMKKNSHYLLKNSAMSFSCAKKEMQQLLINAFFSR